jgi:hypothetical protein
MPGQRKADRAAALRNKIEHDAHALARSRRIDDAGVVDGQQEGKS